jgi:hypothetical protein
MSNGCSALGRAFAAPGSHVARVIAYGVVGAGLLLALSPGGHDLAVRSAYASGSSVPYQLRAAHSGRCMDVTGGTGATANGVAVQQYDCLGPSQTNQQWTFTPAGDGRTFNVKALHSGRCLDVAHGTGAVANGAHVQQYDCLGYAQSNQRWEFVSTGDGRTYYVKAAHSGKCLDVRGGTGAVDNFVPLQQWDCVGYNQTNQRWYFTRGDAVPVLPDLDGDGYDAGQDCNDATSTIHPSAPETASDGIDQDCNGSDAVPGGGSTSPAPQRQGSAVGDVRVLFVRVVNLWLLDGPLTRVKRLALRGVPRGTTVRISCRGDGCPFARRARRAPRGRVSLRRPFNNRPLRPGTIVALRLSMPGVGRYRIRFRMRAGALPRRTDYCPSGRSGKLRRCG